MNNMKNCVEMEEGRKKIIKS